MDMPIAVTLVIVATVVGCLMIVLAAILEPAAAPSEDLVFIGIGVTVIAALGIWITRLLIKTK